MNKKYLFRATEDSWGTFESTNIVIRIGTIETLNSDQPVILINSHYDSAYGLLLLFYIFHFSDKK